MEQDVKGMGYSVSAGKGSLYLFRGQFLWDLILYRLSQQTILSVSAQTLLAGPVKVVFETTYYLLGGTFKHTQSAGKDGRLYEFCAGKYNETVGSPSADRRPAFNTERLV